jgi:hypothetical protein
MDPDEIASAVAAIVGIIKGLVDASATQRWQESVSGKLDVIIVQNATILAILERLPLIFDAELNKYFTTEVVIQGTSLIRDFDQYMKGRHPDVKQIASIRTPSETLTNNIVQRGPCVYQAANAATVLVLAIHKILHVDPRETQALIDTVLGYMTAWAGPGDGMFGKAISDTQALLQHARDALSREPRGNGVVLYSAQTSTSGPRGHGQIHGTIHVLADITIDEVNLTFSVNNARSTWFDISKFDDETVSSQASTVRNRLQGEINTIKALLDRLNTLQQHEAALQKMILALKAWHK